MVQKESKPIGVSIVGVITREGSKLFLDADNGKGFVRFVLSEFGELTPADFLKLNNGPKVVGDDERNFGMLYMEI
jgi:hypothetical protein